MGEEDGFLIAIAADPDDLVTQRVYADWLEEHGRDAASACLRAWCRVASLPYHDDTYPFLRRRLEAYRASLDAPDEAWLRRMADARPWVDASLAEDVARLHLRTRHGRRADRQWIDPSQAPCLIAGRWNVYYHRNPPTRRKPFSPWQGQGCVRVHDRTAEVEER